MVSCDRLVLRACRRSPGPALLVLALLAVGTFVCSGSEGQPQRSAARFMAAPAPDGTYIAWREHVVDGWAVAGEQILGADGLAWADLDGDGRRDVVAVHEDSSHVRIVFGARTRDELFRPGWSGTLTLGSGPLVGAAEDVSVADLDADGRLDVAIACEQGHVVVFFQNGLPRARRGWVPVILQETIGRGSWIRVEAADLDGDGQQELLAVNKGRMEVSVFDAEPGRARKPEAWQEQVLWRTRTPINARAVDIDADGDLDVVAASRGERRIVWLRRDEQSWTEQLIYAGTDPASEGFMMAFADLDRDGQLDIVTEEDHGGRVFWLERTGNGWRFHLIGTIAPDHATGLALADINGDGRLDLFVGGYSAGPRLREPQVIRPSDRCGRLAWFEQPRTLQTEWKRHDVSRRRRGMFDMFVPVDLNADGLVDFVTTRGNSGEFDGVVWLEQRRLPEQRAAFEAAHRRDSPEVPLP